MSIKRTCPISNFTSASDDMRFLYHDLQNLTRESEVREQRSHCEVESRKTGTLQFPVERRHVLRDDFFPTFHELGCLGPKIPYRCFDAIGGRGVNALNFLEQIFGRIQDMQRRSRTR